jgi:ribonucleoside-triphosphate reductase (thioredoxin)
MLATNTATSTLFQEYVYLSRYSRYLHDEERRETWSETVTRYAGFFNSHLKANHGWAMPKELRAELEAAILNMEVMPSMRCVMTAGPALERDHIAGYNCSYIAIDNPKAFAELLYILMCGTGVGFSVERQYINKLPEIPEELHPTDTTIIVADTKLGWAKAVNELVSLLYTGVIPKWDVSKLRPAGAPLKTFGGRSSGPEPLERLFKFIIAMFQANKGQKLTSLDCHDLACMVGECVVVGGVRRSALISLSNLSDDRMRNAKMGQWWTLTPYRSLANNSAVYTEKQPTMDTFMTEWKSLYDSKSGERGIFSRYAAKNVIQRGNAFRKIHFGDDKHMRYRDTDHEFGCNPCSEIILRDKQFCNLSEIVVRSSDTIEDLKRKARVAAIFGTFQSTLTDFRFISRKWNSNTEDERLLGVSMTGIMDNPITNGSKGKDILKTCLTEMRKVVIATNLEYAALLGIPVSVATTCVKPSGTVSSLVDSASGIHARHAPFYLRTIRADVKDPLAHLMIDQGFYHEKDKMRPDHNYVFYFPMKSPKNAVFRHDMDAIKQLELWLFYQQYWAEHKPSVTVSVKDNEWMRVGSWCYDNFEWLAGVSFLPFSEHTYEQAPFQEITEEQYKEWATKMPNDVDWTRLPDYEKSDTTTGSQELACSAGAGAEGVVEMGCNI